MTNSLSSHSECGLVICSEVEVRTHGNMKKMAVATMSSSHEKNAGTNRVRDLHLPILDGKANSIFTVESWQS